MHSNGESRIYRETHIEKFRVICQKWGHVCVEEQKTPAFTRRCFCFQFMGLPPYVFLFKSPLSKLRQATESPCDFFVCGNIIAHFSVVETLVGKHIEISRPC